MALYITFKSTRFSESTKELQFHIGSSLREKFNDFAEKGLKLAGESLDLSFVVTSIFADGHELEYIYSMYDGIPKGKGRSCQWFGDHCKFILANWQDDFMPPGSKDLEPLTTLKQ